MDDVGRNCNERGIIGRNAPSAQSVVIGGGNLRSEGDYHPIVSSDQETDTSSCLDLYHPGDSFFHS